MDWCLNAGGRHFTSFPWTVMALSESQSVDSYRGERTTVRHILVIGQRKYAANEAGSRGIDIAELL